METMNYDKIKGKSNAPLIAFITFIVLGSATVAYALINEPKPTIVGQNALIDVDSSNVVEEKELVEYSIRSVSRTNNDTNYNSNIVLPEISVASVDLTDINEKIKTRFISKYEALEKDASDNVENTFLYKVSYKTYEKVIEGTTYLSIVLSEVITAGGDEFSSKQYSYVIDLDEKQILTLEEAAPLILGYSYRNDVKNAIKDYITSKDILSEEEYNYSITGLEEVYIKDDEFHIIFNPEEPFSKEFGIIDITIKE